MMNELRAWLDAVDRRAAGWCEYPEPGGENQTMSEDVPALADALRSVLTECENAQACRGLFNPSPGLSPDTVLNVIDTARKVRR